MRGVTITNTNLVSELTNQSLNGALPSRKCSIKAPAKCKTSVCVLIEICLQWSKWLGPLSDENCHDEPDVLSNPKEKKRPFRPQWDCLSKDSSDFLLEKFNPRLIISGHTHHGCRQLHKFQDHKIPEWSVASFSWRNRNNPVIVLATLTQDEFVLNKCFLPHESTVINVYIVGSILIVIYCILNSRRKLSRRF